MGAPDMAVHLCLKGTHEWLQGREFGWCSSHLAPPFIQKLLAPMLAICILGCK